MALRISTDSLIPVSVIGAETTLIDAGVTISAPGPFAVSMAEGQTILRSSGAIDAADGTGVDMAGGYERLFQVLEQLVQMSQNAQ